MQSSQIFESEIEVASSLEIFGITKSILKDVAMNVISAKNQATMLHPINAPGTFAYHEGVRSMREVFISLQDGWESDSLNGIEVVSHQKKNLIIVFQNVDYACGADCPKAISEKRISSRKLIEKNSLPLFPEISGQKHENRKVWYLCVSSNEEEVKMELSKPESIDDKGQFSVFSERIFIVNEEEVLLPPTPSDDAFEVDDFDIEVTKKG